MNDLLYEYNKVIESITLLVVDMLQSQHAPILGMYSHKPIETTNDVPFCLVETSEGTYLLSYWKHVSYLFKYLAFYMCLFYRFYSLLTI